MGFAMRYVLLALAISGSNAFFGSRYIASKRGSDLTDTAVNHVLDTLEKRTGVKATSNATTHFYNDAVVDHFDDTVAAPIAKWSQRYYSDDSFWGGEGYPVFLYIGGEGPQSAPTDKLFMYKLAEEHQALVLALEHRYYGESYPVPNMDTANLKYLTSEQALGDLARFIQYVSACGNEGADTLSSPALELPASAMKSKWVSFGGSYPGNLATWLKLKYPALVDGTVGSSAPVFAEYDYYQYAQVTGFAMGYPLIGGSKQCYNTIDKATSDLEALLLSTPGAYGSSDAIPDALKPCGSMKTDLDLSTYEAELFGNFQGTVQYNLQSAGPTVELLCDTMANVTDGGGSALDAFAAATAVFYEGVEGACISSSFEEDYIEMYMANTSFSGLGCDLACTSTRQWIWQSCNEFGYFQTTTGTDQPFAGFTYANLETAGKQVCVQGFGIPESEYTGPKANSKGPVANTRYGGRHVEGINITMPNGNCDPWHALSVVNATDPFYESGAGMAGCPGEQVTTASVVEIDGTAHCRDMYAPGAFESIGIPDTEPVKWAHKVIGEKVAYYIA